MLEKRCKPRAAVLLINTGSPDAPTAPAVRRYLAEFLSDERVVELPRWQWQPILHGIILRTRPAKSAARYKGVWSENGSPLTAHTEATAQALAERMGESVRVLWAMRYGSPSIGAAMKAIEAEGIDRVLVLPLFAQYAPQTTAACFDAVFKHCLKARSVPAIRTVREFHLEPAYINGLAEKIEAHWREHGSPRETGGKLLLSFHGVPQKGVDLGDCYEAQCRETALALSSRLGLDEAAWTLSFQSRFGRAEWLRPYSIDTVQALGRAGVRRLDVVCPGFAADCLETIEEINDELRGFYLAEAPEGSVFHYVSCLNESAAAIDLYAEIISRELQGWL